MGGVEKLTKKSRKSKNTEENSMYITKFQGWKHSNFDRKSSGFENDFLITEN